MPALGVKQAGVAHANDYGPSGALIKVSTPPASFDLQDKLGIGRAWQWRGHALQPLLLQGRGLLSSCLQASWSLPMLMPYFGNCWPAWLA